MKRLLFDVLARLVRMAWHRADGTKVALSVLASIGQCDDMVELVLARIHGPGADRADAAVGLPNSELHPGGNISIRADTSPFRNLTHLLSCGAETLAPAAGRPALPVRWLGLIPAAHEALAGKYPCLLQGF